MPCGHFFGEIREPGQAKGNMRNTDSGSPVGVRSPCRRPTPSDTQGGGGFPPPPPIVGLVNQPLLFTSYSLISSEMIMC